MVVVVDVQLYIYHLGFSIWLQKCFQYKESIDTNQDNHHTNITIHFQKKKEIQQLN